MGEIISGFTPLVHLYFYAGVVMIVIAFLVGVRQWRQVRRAVVQQFGDKPLRILAVCGAFIFACMYTTEESAGIAAWHEAGAAVQHADAGLTMGAGMVAAWLAAFVLMGVVLYAVAHLASNAKNGKLHIQLENFLQEQEAKEIRRMYRRRK